MAETEPLSFFVKLVGPSGPMCGGSHNMLFMFKGSRVLIATCKNSCDLKIVFVLLPDSAPGWKTLLGRGPGLGLGKAKDWPLYPPACPPWPGHSYLKIFLTFACFACSIVFSINPLLILHQAYGNSGTDRFSFWSRNNNFTIFSNLQKCPRVLAQDWNDYRVRWRRGGNAPNRAINWLCNVYVKAANAEKTTRIYGNHWLRHRKQVNFYLRSLEIQITLLLCLVSFLLLFIQ